MAQLTQFMHKILYAQIMFIFAMVGICKSQPSLQVIQTYDKLISLSNAQLNVSGSIPLEQNIAYICSNTAFVPQKQHVVDLLLPTTNQFFFTATPILANRTMSWHLKLNGAWNIDDIFKAIAEMYQCFYLNFDNGGIFLENSHYRDNAILILNGKVSYVDEAQKISKLDIVPQDGMKKLHVLIDTTNSYICIIEIEIYKLRFRAGDKFYDYGYEPFANKYPSIKWKIDDQFILVTSCTNLLLNRVNDVDLMVKK